MGNSTDYLQNGIGQYRDENYEEALELFKKAELQDPKSSVLAFYMGLSYKQIGELEKAKAYFEKSLTLVPPTYDSFMELIEILYAMNNFDEAMVWIKKAELLNVQPSKIAFLKGLVFAKKNNRLQSIEAFKKAKALDSKISQAADLQIALNYAALRKFKEAKASLDRVIETDPETEIATFAEGYKKAVESGADMFKEWRFTIGISARYDDNVVLSPSESDSMLAATDETDGAMMNTFSINYNPIINDEHWLFTANYSIFNLYYFEIDEYNAIVNSLTFNPGYRLSKQTALTMPTNLTYSLLDKDGYMSTLSLKPTISWMFYENNVGQVYTEYEKRNLMGEIYDADEDRDADVYLAGLGYYFTFSGGKGVFNAKGELSYDETEGQNWKNRGYKLGLGLYTPIISKLSLMASGELFYQRYNSVHTAFGVKRTDTTLNGVVNLAYQMLKPLYLNVTYAHTTANSNIFVYDYKRNMYSGGIEYRF